MSGPLQPKRSAGEDRPVRFGLVADAHYADRPDEGTRRHRAALVRLRRATSAIEARGADFLVQLGDLKDRVPGPGAAPRALRDLRAGAGALAAFRGPVVHVLGNHDLACLSKAEVLRVLRGGGRGYVRFDFGGIRFLVLDANFTPGGQPYRRGRFAWNEAWLPPRQLDWLQRELAAGPDRAVVFVHQRLDLDGNPHTVRNAPAARQVMERSGRVLAVFQGHDHAGGRRALGGITYYTLPALVESRGQPVCAIASIRGSRVSVTRVRLHAGRLPA